MSRLFAVVICFSLCALGAVAGTSKKIALQAEGIWTAGAGSVDGKKIPDAVMEERIYVVTMKDGKYRFTLLGKQVEAGTYKIAAAKTLGEFNIDLTVTEGKNKGNLKPGLLRMPNVGEMALAFATGDRKERPKGFKPAEGVEITIFRNDR